MKKFKYKVLDSNGVTVKVEVEAFTQDAAIALLGKRRLEVFTISALPLQAGFQFFKKQAKPKDLARYVRQLTTLLSQVLLCLKL